MLRENFWLSLKSLAAFLDGNRETSEATLDALESQLRDFDAAACDAVLDDMTLVIAQLSRLKMRMIDR